MTRLDRYVEEVSPFRIPILERVPQGASVLDVGPWSGAHGNWLMEHRGATVDGVELNPAAGAEAAKTYRTVVIGAIDDPAMHASLARYDAILFLDVLEHLADPAAVLRAARDWLQPRGAILVSLPNVAHWRIRLALLRGRFEYEETGLMDRTHLRWFTRATARRLIDEAGYTITWEEAAAPQHPRIKVPQGLLKPELFAYQLYFEASPT